MKIDDVKEVLNKIVWFSNLGKFTGDNKFIPIKTLNAWKTELESVDEYHEKIANQMIWLPSNRDMSDPFHLELMKDIAKRTGKLEPFEAASREIYKLTLSSFRSFNEISELKAGQHNFNPVAKGAALYAFRMAASEIALGIEERWVSLIPLYFNGNFPCGFLPDKRIVVF